jgi:hypothetical protein
MAKQMKQDMFLEVKEKINTLLSGKKEYEFSANTEETLKNISYQFERFYDKKEYIFSKSQKEEILSLVDIYQNKIKDAKEEAINKIEEANIKRIESYLKEEEENKQKIQKFIEENKGKDVDWDHRRFNLIALENDKHFNENENAIFWQVSEDLVKDMIKILLPNEDKPYHKNLTKLLWNIKNNQKAGIKFKNANFDWTVLVHQWKTSKGY